MIAISRPTSPVRGNAYRAILRREYPEPLIALLAFLLGIWLWNHHLRAPSGYSPGTEQVTLLRIDRDLRLAEAMRDDSFFLRRLAGAASPAATRDDAIAALSELGNAQALSPRGFEALHILVADQIQISAMEALAQMPGGVGRIDAAAAREQLTQREGTWWHAKYLDELAQHAPETGGWHQAYRSANSQLRSRALAARGGLWLVGALGLIALPTTLRCFRRGLAAQPQGYGGAWPASLGLMIFLAATLAWIGFSLALDLGLASLPTVHPALGILLDSSARLLPALIAVALLFRRPSHALRTMGCTQPVHITPVLGSIALLMLADIPLRLLFGISPATDPAGGLNSMESGLWGLVFVVVSACIMAPISEEILYRGVLFRALWNRYGVLPAAIIAALIFALLHFYGSYGLASVAIFGFTGSLIYASTGSLVSTVLFHACYNASIKLPEWIMYHAPLG